MPTPVDLVGQRFHHLVAVEAVKHKGRWCWVCRCDCGRVTKSVQSRQLRSGHTKSCGCAQREAVRKTGQKSKHGHAARSGRSKSYTTWRAMLARCADTHPKRRKYYLDRGIAVCDRWKLFENFLADMGERPAGMTLDRKDNDVGYTPDNCRWATWAEQRENQRRNT